MINPFKSGDWVICITSSGLFEGMAYQVYQVVTNGEVIASRVRSLVYVKPKGEGPFGYLPERFVLASPEMKNLSGETRANVIDMLNI